MHLIAELVKVRFTPLPEFAESHRTPKSMGYTRDYSILISTENLIMVGGSAISIDRESVCAQAPGGGVRMHTPQTDMIDGGMRQGAMSRSADTERDRAVQSVRLVQAKRASSRMARVRGSSIACHEISPGPITQLA